jgi:hypothetical protein
MKYHNKSQITRLLIKLQKVTEFLKAMGLGWRLRTTVMGRKLF